MFLGISEGLSLPGKFRHFCSFATGTATPSLLQAFFVTSQISGHGTDKKRFHRLRLGLVKKLGFFCLITPPPKAGGQSAGGGLCGMFYKKYRKVYTFLYTCQRSSKVHISRIVYKKVDSVSHETILLHSKKAQKHILLLYRHLVAYSPSVKCSAIPLHKRQCALGLQRHWAIALAFLPPRT